MRKRTNKATNSEGPLISTIRVDDLFYTYSYILQPAQSVGPESGRLMLLYGNNGAGKTTILNLLYHLLHSEPYGGHRSFVGGIPFRRFEVRLLDGVSVVASRAKNCDPGNYHVQVNDASGGSVLKWMWRPDQRKRSGEEEPDYTLLCTFLKNLGITFHYLRDTRRVEGSVRAHGHVFRRKLGSSPEELFLIGDIEEPDEMLSPKRQLQHSIEAAVQWFRQQALSATNVGYTSVNSIYRDLIKRIVQPGASKSKTTELKTDQLIASLVQLKERNNAFARFGLTPDLEIQEIISSLNSSLSRHVTMLNTVLGPYLEGHQARLDALQELQAVMNSFVSLLGEFYSHKTTKIHLERGLQLLADTGHELQPEMLSSGEKQLLLLFCNAISARRDRTILMIDEPEISLNVTWQRRLIPALLTCMSGTAFQIILATHSVELLAQYRECVTPLDNESF
jgi:energy-coupling factor transporter ATP-binding protein EcfA2